MLTGRTVVVIAHRLDAAAAADRVAVVIDGRIVELGPHEELSEISDLFLEIEEKLRRLLKSSARTVIFPASGTGLLEALAANFTGPDTRVLSVSCGVFGERFREIVALTGVDVKSVDVSFGCGVSPDVVADAVADDRSEERRVGKECRSRWSPYH